MAGETSSIFIGVVSIILSLFGASVALYYKINEKIDKQNSKIDTVDNELNNKMEHINMRLDGIYNLLAQNSK